MTRALKTSRSNGWRKPLLRSRLLSCELSSTNSQAEILPGRGTSSCKKGLGQDPGLLGPNQEFVPLLLATEKELQKRDKLGLKLTSGPYLELSSWYPTFSAWQAHFKFGFHSWVCCSLFKSDWVSKEFETQQNHQAASSR